MAKVALDLDGPRVTVGRFLKAVESLLVVLREVDKEVSRRPKASLRWVISELRTASAHLAAVAEPVDEGVGRGSIGEIVNTAADGIALLERDGEERPRHFSDTALEAAKSLTSTLKKGSVSRIHLTFSRRRIEVTPRTAATVDRFIGEQFKSLGSVEGRLEVISIHGRPLFRVYDRVSRRPVDCHFTKADVEDIWPAFGKRVTVYGILRSRASGEPVSIEVKGTGDVVVQPPDDELPESSQVRGILR